MRNAFARQLLALADRDPRVVALSGDIGNRLFDAYRARHGDRFINCGVAEANMIGVAAGMALCGWRPVVYTIIPFLVTRCLEQIRVDLCYHELPVVLVGVGGGLGYASLGPTHHALEDIAQLRSLPGMTVLCPGDAAETEAALAVALAHEAGPVYVRLGKKNEPRVHDAPPSLAIGGSLRLAEGTDGCLLACGTVLPEVCAARAALAAEGLELALHSTPSVKPLDAALLAEEFARQPLVVTVEEHGRAGGFGAAVAEWAADHAWGMPADGAGHGPAPVRGDRRPARLLRLGTPDAFQHDGGSPAEARARVGLSADGIARAVRAALGQDRRSRGAGLERGAPA